jgi:hypothetical protein
MGIDPKGRFTKGDEAGNVQDRFRHELMKLHTVNKKKPAEEFMGRERESPHKRKARNITRNPLGGLGMRSVLGKMTWSPSAMNPSFWALVRSDCPNSEGT